MSRTMIMTLGDLIADAFEVAGVAAQRGNDDAEWVAVGIVGAVLESGSATAASLLGIRLDLGPAATTAKLESVRHRAHA